MIPRGTFIDGNYGSPGVRDGKALPDHPFRLNGKRLFSRSSSRELVRPDELSARASVDRKERPASELSTAHSDPSTVDSGSQLCSKPSVRKKLQVPRARDVAKLASTSASPDKKNGPSAANQHASPALQPQVVRSSSTDQFGNGADGPFVRPQSSAEPKHPRGFSMTATGKREDPYKVPSNSNSTLARAESYGSSNLALNTTLSGSTVAGGASGALLSSISDGCSKRIQMLEYLRRTHEGRMHWFNTVLFDAQSLTKMPYFDQQKLTRRANNYLFLGLSIPMILDPNSNNLIEYLRAFNSLLTEFESYQTIHSPDGASVSSLSRARLPQMFKRATQAGQGKSRRASDAVTPAVYHDMPEHRSNSGQSATNQGNAASVGADRDLLPGEDYSFLLTPNLPFDPDYYETFATLCDVVIDSYSKILTMLGSDAEVASAAMDLFNKVDAKVKRVMASNIVKEFDDTTKQGIRSELSGIARLTLGGLM